MIHAAHLARPSQRRGGDLLFATAAGGGGDLVRAPFALAPLAGTTTSIRVTDRPSSLLGKTIVLAAIRQGLFQTTRGGGCCRLGLVPSPTKQSSHLGAHRRGTLLGFSAAAAAFPLGRLSLEERSSGLGLFLHGCSALFCRSD